MSVYVHPYDLNMADGRVHQWTFVIGAAYRNVLSQGMNYSDVIQALKGHCGDGWRKPFALIQMTEGTIEDFDELINSGMIDLNLV